MNKILLLLLPLLLVSCATSQTTKKALSDPRLEKLAVPSQRLEVPFIVQTNELCGPTALKMALDDAHIENDLAILTKYTYSPSVKGSTKSDMLGAVRRLGLVPILVRELPLLFDHISHNRAVIVFYNAGASFHTLWHFGVLTGYDLKMGKVFVHAGEEQNQRMNLSWFYERWSEGDQWAMVVSTVSALPQNIELSQMVENLDVFINLEDFKTARELLEVLKMRYPQEKVLSPYREILGV